MVPYSSIGVSDTLEPWLSEKHKAAAREVTQKTIVLLKNSNNALPLDRSKLRSIAVIGPRADEVLLDWYSGTPPYIVTPLAGIRNKVGNGMEVKYAKDNTDGAAVKITKAADVAIVCVGNHPYCDGAEWGKCLTPSDGREAVDRQVIILEQEELIKQVYSANRNTVVVLISSFPYAINWTQEDIPAIIHLTHSSQELGNVLTDALFGKVNPGGRLVQTWPKAIEQLPPMMDYNIYTGRTYMHFKGEPLYPFGYGLSYTTFTYSNLRVSSKNLKAQSEISVSVDLRNTGKRAGDEVVQMYVKHLSSHVERPLKELRGFKRVTVKPNETKTVNLQLKAETLAYWDKDQHRFVVEPGKTRIMVGSSSADIKLQETIEVMR
jgi:beta-glucosidase